MYIVKNYKYEKDGIVYVGGKLPEGAIILEEMNILCAEEGYTLKRKKDGEIVGNSILLKAGDTEDNYEEIKEEEPK